MNKIQTWLAQWLPITSASLFYLLLFFSAINASGAQLVKIAVNINVEQSGETNSGYTPFSVGYASGSQAATYRGSAPLFCVSEWAIPTVNLTVESGVPYKFTLNYPSLGFCGTMVDANVSAYDVDSCAGADVFVNGYTNIFKNNNLRQAGATFMVQAIPHSFLFGWDYPVDGVQALKADGVSTISGSATNGSANLQWSFDGDNLGCKLLITNGPTVVVQSGTNTGSIKIRAALPSLGECETETLKLVKCDEESCSACQSGGGFSAGNRCVELKFNLGWAKSGGSADFLQVKEDYPSAALATPATLHYNFIHTDVGILTNSLGIRQVVAPQMVVDVITNSAGSYSLQLYNPTNIASGPTAGGSFYTFNGSPYRTITIENPDGDTNELLVTDSNDNATYDYTWQTNGWLLVSGDGLRKELKASVATNGLCITTTKIWSGTSAPVETRVETWAAFSTNSQRLVQEVFGSGAAARTNSYSYNTDGFLQQVVRWDGSWEYYLYDTNYRPVKIYSGFGNQGVTTNQNLCHLIVNDYTTIAGSGDCGWMFFNTPRCTTEYVQGQEVSRKYFIGMPGQRKEIQCVTPGAAWDDTNNLVTTYNLFQDDARYNEPWEIIHPDGTAEIYQYSDVVGADSTNIVWSGHLDATGTNIDDGTETITTIDSKGLQRTKTVIDIRSGLCTDAQLYDYDSLNRLATTVYLDGTYMQNSYDCCTIDAQRDRDGTVTSYSHDALKRLLTTTLNSVTTSNIYDAAGNILEVVRYGSDGTAITNQQTAYDDGGQEISVTDGLNHTTVYTNYFDGSGQLVRQTTYPDNSTRIETYYQDGTLQSITGTAVAPMRYVYGVESDGGIQRRYTKVIQLDTNDDDTGNWQKSYQDGIGRVYKIVYADSALSQSVYNNRGQLGAQMDPDGVTTLYQYDDRGRLTITATDMNTNGIIDFDGNDRITENVSDVLTDNGINVNRTRTYVWTTDGDSSSNLVSTTEASVDGLQNWSVAFNQGVGMTNYSLTSYDSTYGYRWVKTIAPDASFTIVTNHYGRMTGISRRAQNGMPISHTIYGYDAHGRQNTITDGRNGTTTYYYNHADQVVATLTPSPDGVSAGQLTTNILDNMGRVIETILPDDSHVTNVYYANGLLQKTSGSRTYPVQYTYDAQQRMKTMTTWTNFASSAGAAVTTWNYDDARGFLTNKAYADGLGPDYTYTPAGRLQTRVWARGITTTYGHDNAGSLDSVSYSDATPAVNYGFDRQGRQVAVTNGATVCHWTYNDLGQQTGESYTGGPLDGLSVTNGYDQLLRRTSLALNSQLSTINSTVYGYDTVSRLQTVSDGTNTAVYSYLENSPLVGHIAFQHNGQTVMVTTKQYDYLNRLTAIASTRSHQLAPINSFVYNYNTANQRTSVTNADDTYWVYQYDNLGQVISGKKYWADGTPVAGQQFTYNFDDIGNRQQTQSGGDALGANLRSASYTANNLNQYTSREVPGYVDVLGSANPEATVTVNLQRAVRQGDYFWDELPVDNSSSALWLTLTNLAVLNNGTNADIVATNLGNMFVPQTPEVFGYDADGNLTNDGRWSYVWDAENRLINMTSLSSAPAGSKRKLDFAYDYMGRRIKKIVSVWNVPSNDYQPSTTNRFVYDGWNLIAILDPESSILKSFTWGLDLSGSMQGAGGVGGLLSMTVYSGADASSYYYTYDGNGNVIALVSAATGEVAGQWEYGPFGKLLKATGLLAAGNPFLFSSKFYDGETGLSYYGYRYHDANIGAWPNRDPLDELGGENLYNFVSNDPLNTVDNLGLLEISASGGLGLGLHVEGSITLNIEDKGCQKVIKLTAEGAVGAGAGLKARFHVWKHEFDRSFDFSLPVLKRTQTITLTRDCCGYLNFNESIDLIRVGLDHSFSAGVGLGFVAFHASFGVKLNGGVNWVINANSSAISTWLEWSGELGGYYKITGGFGEHTDAVLAQGEGEGSHDFHKIIFGPETYRF